VIERMDDPQRFADMVTEQQNLIAKLGVMGLTVNAQVQPLLPELRIATGVVIAARTGDGDYWGDDLQQGDVIHSVNGKTVTDVSSLLAAIDALPATTPLVLQVERGGTLNYLVMERD